MSKKPSVSASLEIELPNLTLEIHRCSKVENRSKEIEYFFSSAVYFLEAITKEIEIFQHFELRFVFQIRKTRDGCLVEFCQISKSNGERIRLRKYKVQDFEALSCMKHDLVDLKIEFARKHFEAQKHFEDRTPSLETQLQTDTLQTDV